MLIDRLIFSHLHNRRRTNIRVQPGNGISVLSRGFALAAQLFKRGWQQVVAIQEQNAVCAIFALDVDVDPGLAGVR
ncbi:hypothetical protein D9M70_627740 [compost metagenome]